MRQALVIAVTLLLTSASCSLDMPAAATDLDAAGFWKARIDRDIPAGTSPEEVESYLRANGALEIALSEDRKGSTPNQRLNLDIKHHAYIPWTCALFTWRLRNRRPRGLRDDPV